jgi:hypothetical protein
MVADSDRTYMTSTDNRLLIKEIEGRGYDVHNTRACGYNMHTFQSRTCVTCSSGDKLYPVSQNYTSPSQTKGLIKVMYDRNGYSDDSLFSKCKLDSNFEGHFAGTDALGGKNPDRELQVKWGRYSDTNTDEIYGNPVCFGPVPGGDTVDITFPTRAGKGWANFKNLITNIRNAFFTRRFQVHKTNGDVSIAATCAVDGRENEDTPITPINLAIGAATVSLNTPTPAPTSTQTSYNILDLDTVYSQLDIAKIDLPKRRDAVIQNELNNIFAINDNSNDNWGVSESNLVSADFTPSSGVTSNGILKEQMRRVRMGYTVIMKEMRAQGTQLTN